MSDRRSSRAPQTGVSRLIARGLSLLIIAAVVAVAIAASRPASAQPGAPGTPTPVASIATLASATPSAAATPAPSGRGLPGVSLKLAAKAAFAVDLTHGVELYSQRADTPLPPASTTKIVTALVVVGVLQPSDQVTIQESDTVDPTVYSNMGLQPGDVLSVRDLLAGMFLNSAGDAAQALARTAGAKVVVPAGRDPTADFVAEMNRTARRLGMRNSHFLDPDGRDEPGHVSTARDLALATQALFTHPLLEQLVAEPAAAVQVRGPAARTIDLVNTNEMLGVAGVHGVKTGTTDAAGQCLVAAVWKGGARILTVVLGSDDRYADTRALLDGLNQEYRWLRLGRDGDAAALNDQLKEEGLALAVVEPILLTAAQASELRYDLQLNPRPASGWTPQGVVTFTAGGVTILRLPVYRGDPVAQP